MRTTLFAAVLSSIACAPGDRADPFDPARDALPYFTPQEVTARAPFARPVAEDEIYSRFEDSFAADAPRPTGMDAGRLRAQVVDALNVGYLLRDFERRDFTVTPRLEVDGGDFVWRRVTLSDAYVVDLTVDLLVPKGRAAAARPAVLGLHGHRDVGAVFLRSYLGVDLARKGYVVAAPTFRHMDCGDEERNQSVYLLRDGFTLMGQRVYEALLALKFLRALDGVDPARVGIAAHSGGSSTANLLVRLSDWPAVLVTDYQVEFRNLCGGQAHCETVPALLPLAADVNAQETLAIPHLRIDYGYRVAQQRAAVLAFLDQRL